MAHVRNHQESKIKNKRAYIDQYVSAAKDKALKLIELVRQNEVLYNSATEGYNDKNLKEATWDHVNRTLFPEYDTFDEEHRVIIDTIVRRRWKILRNSLAKEMRKCAMVKNHIRRKSIYLNELEFLIPHIKGVYSTKLVANIQQNDTTNYHYDTITPCDDESIDDLIDLTSDFYTESDHYSDKEEPSPTDDEDLNNENIGMEYHGYGSHSVTVTSSTVENIFEVTNDEISTLNNNTNDAESSTTINSCNWAKDYCSIAQYQGGEFMNSTSLVCQNTDNEMNHKRTRSDSDYSTELQAKILQLLTNLERRERAYIRSEEDAQDEDRMFLLSLVSDLKRVPLAKKVCVKAEITNAIARGIQQ